LNFMTPLEFKQVAKKVFGNSVSQKKPSQRGSRWSWYAPLTLWGSVSTPLLTRRGKLLAGAFGRARAGSGWPQHGDSRPPVATRGVEPVARRGAWTARVPGSTASAGSSATVSASPLARRLGFSGPTYPGPYDELPVSNSQTRS
jgi:hypothetical protein